jgi:nucleosome binding factor SPN SPT16 subunit
MEKYAIDKILDAIDKGDKLTHEKLSTLISNAIDGKDKKYKPPSDVDAERIEECYTPYVQSGGVYDLKPAAKSNKDVLHAGTIVCSLGARYKSMCSNLARTFLIDPSKTKRSNYAFLLQLQDHLLKNVVKDGVVAKDVYEGAVAYVKEHKPDLEQYFVKNAGFSMGAEMRESTYLLNSKCERKLATGMVVNLSLGFQGVPEPTAKDAKSRTYALFLADTVVVGEDGGTVLTAASKKDEESVCYYLEEEEKGTSTKKENKAPNGDAPAKSKASAILPTRTRNELKRDEVDTSAAVRRREHQKALAEAIQRAGEQKYRDGNQKDKGEEVVVKKPESYRRVEQVPSNKESRIIVDPGHSTVLLPIYGVPVPFHVALIKTVTKSDEGEFTVLRFNFAGPGLAGKKTELPYVDDVNASFIRAIAFRSTETARFDNVFRQINDMKKDYAKRWVGRRGFGRAYVDQGLTTSNRPTAKRSGKSARISSSKPSSRKCAAVVRLFSRTASSARNPSLVGNPASSRCTPTVCGTRPRSSRTTGSTFCSATSSTFSTSLAKASSLSCCTAISSTRS